MKDIGIVRSLDNLGRIVLPIELRRLFNIAAGDMIEIYTDGDLIVLHKYQNKCEFCGSNDVVTEYKDKSLCKDCLYSIKAMNFQQESKKK